MQADTAELIHVFFDQYDFFTIFGSHDSAGIIEPASDIDNVNHFRSFSVFSPFQVFSEVSRVRCQG